MSLPVSTTSVCWRARAAMKLRAKVTSATIFTSPRALSAGVGSARTLPKLLAVALAGAIPTGPPAISPTVRSTRLRSPWAAICSRVSRRVTPSKCRAKPSSVPPPTPVPPTCSIVFPWTDTRAVPVPSDTTRAEDFSARVLPPTPIASISETLATGTPKSWSSSQRAPPPLTAIAWISANTPPTVLSSLPRAPAAAARGSPVSIVTTTISPLLTSTASVVEPPISIPTIIPSGPCYGGGSSRRYTVICCLRSILYPCHLAVGTSAGVTLRNPCRSNSRCAPSCVVLAKR